MEALTVLVVILISRIVMIYVVLLIVLLDLGVLGQLPTVLCVTLAIKIEPEISLLTFTVVVKPVQSLLIPAYLVFQPLL
jgi:hypothetical protein